MNISGKLLIGIIAFGVVSTLHPFAWAGFNDEFNSAALDSRWEVVNPNPASSISITGEAVRITASEANGGSDYYYGSNYNAPRILQPVSSDWMLEIKLDFNPTTDYQGAGIIIIPKGQDASSTSGNRIAEKAFSGGAKVIRSVGTNIPWTDSTAYIRLSKRGYAYTGWVSADGVNWTLNGTWEDPSQADTAYVGLFSIRQPWTGSATSTPEFDYFRFAENLECMALPEGAVSWWGGDMTAADGLADNNGVLIGGAGYADGYTDQAFALDGADDAVRITAAQSLRLQSLTMEAWIFPEADSFGPVMEYNQESGVSPSYGPNMGVSASGAAYGSATSSTSTFLESGEGAVTLNAWNHLAFTYDISSGIETLIINGAVKAQNSIGSLILKTSYPLYIGRRPASHNGPDDVASFHGLIDEATIYSRALSASEIQSIFNKERHNKCWPGDADGNRTTDLADAILCLQILAATSQEKAMVGAAVDGDGALDLREILFILRKLAGLS